MYAYGLLNGHAFVSHITDYNMDYEAVNVFHCIVSVTQSQKVIMMYV